MFKQLEDQFTQELKDHLKKREGALGRPKANWTKRKEKLETTLRDLEDGYLPNTRPKPIPPSVPVEVHQHIPAKLPVGSPKKVLTDEQKFNIAQKKDAALAKLAQVQMKLKCILVF
jgi:hypothetical protein